MTARLDAGQHDWLGYLQPVGLVVAPTVLARLGLWPEPQGRADGEAVAAALDALAAGEAWPLFRDVLGWSAGSVAGAPGGPMLPGRLVVSLRDGETLLEPTWGVEGADGFQLLVRIEAPGTDLDRRGALDGWEATPQQRFERLLKETGVGAGVLLGAQGRDPVLRLVVAPRGEAPGHIGWPLAALTGVAGRGMLGGLKLLLDRHALFTGAPTHRLTTLLAESRAAQAEVSTKLAGQVLASLHELLRGLDAAGPELVRELAARDPQHLYEGLLTVLLWLIFILYAEDRDLMPSSRTGGAAALYERGYALGGLHARLQGDAAAHAELIDERRGAWGQMLALFGLVERGHDGFMQARGGRLFDRRAFPFLLGRTDADAPERVLPVSDGCVFRVLDALLTLDAERVQYRALSVEQIGSVYEAVMGFTAVAASGPMLAIKAGKGNRVPVWIDLAELARVGGGDRAKWLKERTGRGTFGAAVTTRHRWEGEAAVVVSQVFVRKRGEADAGAVLDGKPVRRISAYLVEGDLDGSPVRLRSNRKQAFEGSKLYGAGFAFRDDRPASAENTLAGMRRIIAAHPASASVVKPLLGGEDIVTNVGHDATRFAINFSGLTEAEASSRFPQLFGIVRATVRPERQRVANTATRDHWWLYERERPELYASIAAMPSVLVTCRVSPHLSIARVPAAQVFGESVDVFALSTNAAFATLQSRIHEVWARTFASSMKDDLRYTPSDCFETFPLPPGYADAPELEAAGQAYHDHRAQLMIARDQGMTPTYNRFHTPADTAGDITELRRLHATMDAAVLRAYGWDDLAERAAPAFLDEETEADHQYQKRLHWPAPFRDELLARLLLLNAERARTEAML